MLKISISSVKVLPFPTFRSFESAERFAANLLANNKSHNTLRTIPEVSLKLCFDIAQTNQALYRLQNKALHKMLLPIAKVLFDLPRSHKEVKSLVGHIERLELYVASIGDN